MNREDRYGKQLSVLPFRNDCDGASWPSGCSCQGLVFGCIASFCPIRGPLTSIQFKDIQLKESRIMRLNVYVI